MPRRKSPVTTAVDVTKGTAAIGRMVAGQVARTALTAAGGALGAVSERAGRRKVPHTSGPVAGPDLRAVPEPAPAPIKVHGDPVAPTRKTATKAPATKASVPSPADVAKVAAKKTTANTTAAKKTAAKKTTAKNAPAKKTTAKKTTAKKTAAKKTAAKKTAAKKTAAKKAPGAPGDRLPVRKTPRPTPDSERRPEAR